MDWLAHYQRKHLPGDALAGVIVATLLIPQAMAYALLAGLPPQVGLYASLLPLALAISFIGFLENISVAKSLAAKRRQKVDSDQEFIALGAANLAAGVTGGYPVSGSFARSMVNFTAGANTGLASLITVAVIGMAALFLMPLFHHLPQAVLAAIIILAVIGLMDFGMPRRTVALQQGGRRRADPHVRRGARSRGHARHPDRRSLDDPSPSLAHEPTAHGRRRAGAQHRALSQRPAARSANAPACPVVAD
jgi:MFS superfamily sulfate permease-like transporter